MVFGRVVYTFFLIGTTGTTGTLTSQMLILLLRGQINHIGNLCSTNRTSCGDKNIAPFRSSGRGRCHLSVSFSSRPEPVR